MEKFAKYMAAVDGGSDWATVQPLFDDAFDPECIFVTADGEYDKQQWSEMARGLVENGAVASGFEITRREGDAAYYKLTVTVGDGEHLHMTAKGALRDGRLVRVEPVDPSVYSTMVEQSR